MAIFIQGDLMQDSLCLAFLKVIPTILFRCAVIVIVEVWTAILLYLE